MEPTILAYRVQMACTLASAAAAQILLDATLGEGQVDVSGPWRTLYALAAAPTVATHAVAAGLIQPGPYAQLAAGALAAGLSHLVVAQVIDRGEGPVEEVPEGVGDLYEQMGIVPLEIP